MLGAGVISISNNVIDKLRHLKMQRENPLSAALEASRWFRRQFCWLRFSRLPCATGLVKGLECVNVLLEPPPGCPVPLPRPAGDPFSSQTHWPILLPFALASCCQTLHLRLAINKNE